MWSAVTAIWLWRSSLSCQDIRTSFVAFGGSLNPSAPRNPNPRPDLSLLHARTL